jgi:hypothetical protein
MSRMPTPYGIQSPDYVTRKDLENIKDFLNQQLEVKINNSKIIEKKFAKGFVVNEEDKIVYSQKATLQEAYEELYPLLGDNVELYDFELNKKFYVVESSSNETVTEEKVENKSNEDIEYLKKQLELLKSGKKNDILLTKSNIRLMNFLTPNKLCYPDFPIDKMLKEAIIDPNNNKIKIKIAAKDANGKDAHRLKVLQDWENLIFNEKEEVYRDKKDYKGSLKISYSDSNNTITPIVLSNISPIIKKRENEDWASLDRITDHYERSMDLDFTIEFQYDDLIYSS